MKRADGSPADVAPEQWLWLDRLRILGWETFVAYGALDALSRLHALGYPVPDVYKKRDVLVP